MSAPVFPDEPIRFPDDAPAPIGADVYDDYDDELDHDGDSCMSCGGDAFKECDDDCPESDDCGCPYRSHLTTCPNCGGSGDARDQRYW